MTAPAPPRTVNPLRAKALDYLRSGRVLISWSTSASLGQEASVVRALISPAPGGPSGLSVHVNVALNDRVWLCSEHGDNPCSHKLAVQTVTGWEHLGGRSTP